MITEQIRSTGWDKIYVMVILCGIVSTAFTIEWNLNALRAHISHVSTRSNPQALFHGLNADGTLSVTIVKGSPAYYGLDCVRSAIVSEVQAANDELQGSLLQPPSTSSTIVRGVMIYLPPNMNKFQRELKAMYLSLAIMRLNQPVNVKTDFLVFTTGDNFGFPESVGCSRTPRVSHEESEKCVVIPHIPLAQRDLQTEVLKDYTEYIDSILILSEFNYTQQYDFLMRSDSDTFLTPSFGNWTLPPGVHIATGYGGYGCNNVNARLEWITTQQLGLKDVGLRGVGSTWYGRSTVMVAAAKLTVASMRWLDSQEFTYYEKHNGGVEDWPHWHWLVLLLYGGHIAMNQIPSSKIVTNTHNVMELDHNSAYRYPLSPAIKHIHCWHTEEFFSKFLFEMGFYKGVDLTKYKDMETVPAYAGVIAISSDRLSVTELAHLINNTTAIQNQEWMRLTV